MVVKIELVNRYSNKPSKFLSRSGKIIYGNVLLKFENEEEAQEFNKRVRNDIKIFLEECLKLL